MGEMRDELDLSLRILEQLRAQLANRDAEIAALRAELAGVIDGHKASVAMWEQQDYNNYTEIAVLRQQVAELQAWKAAVPVIALYRYVYNAYEKSLPGTAPVDLKQINAWFDKVQPT